MESQQVRHHCLWDGVGWGPRWLEEAGETGAVSPEAQAPAVLGCSDPQRLSPSLGGRWLSPTGAFPQPWGITLRS